MKNLRNIVREYIYSHWSQLVTIFRIGFMLVVFLVFLFLTLTMRGRGEEGDIAVMIALIISVMMLLFYQLIHHLRQ